MCQVKRFFVLLFIVNAAIVFAQPTIRLGAHVDPILTWYSPRTSNIERDGARLGYNGGLIVETYFRPNYAFVTGLSLTSLGGNLMYKDSASLSTSSGNNVIIPDNTTVAYNLTYLSLPVALKLKSNEIGYFTYYAQLGFTPQFNIGSRATSTDDLLSKDNVSEEINLFNLSYFFGGGIEYNIGGQTSLIAGIFFNNGFVDVMSSSKHKAILNYLTIRIGMMF
jgi:hypothetical protein